MIFSTSMLHRETSRIGDGLVLVFLRSTPTLKSHLASSPPSRSCLWPVNRLPCVLQRVCGELHCNPHTAGISANVLLSSALLAFCPFSARAFYFASLSPSLSQNPPHTDPAATKSAALCRDRTEKMVGPSTTAAKGPAVSEGQNQAHVVAAAWIAAEVIVLSQWSKTGQKTHTPSHTPCFFLQVGQTHEKHACL